MCHRWVRIKIDCGSRWCRNQRLEALLHAQHRFCCAKQQDRVKQHVVELRVQHRVVLSDKPFMKLFERCNCLKYVGRGLIEVVQEHVGQRSWLGWEHDVHLSLGWLVRPQGTLKHKYALRELRPKRPDAIHILGTSDLLQQKLTGGHDLVKGQQPLLLKVLRHLHVVVYRL